MQLSIKTLKGSVFTVEVDSSKTVLVPNAVRAS